MAEAMRLGACVDTYRSLTFKSDLHTFEALAILDITARSRRPSTVMSAAATVAAATPVLDAQTGTAKSAVIPPIVAVGGLIGHGKDVIAKFIEEIALEEGIVYDWSKFATDLRKAVTIITDIPAEETTSDEGKAKPLPIRFYTIKDLKQRIGSAIKFATEKDPEGQMIATIAGILTRIPPGLFLSGGYAANEEKSQTSIENMTMGRFLQVLGTDAFRDHIHQDIWVNSYDRRRARGGNKPTLTPDTRFPNEVAFVKAAGGVTIYVTRPGYGGRNDGRATGHASENKAREFIESFDIHIENDGSLEDLRQKIRMRWPLIKLMAMKRVQAK